MEQLDDLILDVETRYKDLSVRKQKVVTELQEIVDEMLKLTGAHRELKKLKKIPVAKVE